MTERCNCDASCGENRYHDVGSSGCRFTSKEQYDAYWNVNKERNQTTVQSAWDDVIRKNNQEILNQLEPKPMFEMPKMEQPTSMKRPWGSWHVLNVGNGFKVKRLEILVDQSISMQYHMHRSEHWLIVQGEGRVIVDGNIFTVKKGDHFFVPKQSIHKVTNTSLKETLIAVEVQMGDICEESDIIRV